MEIRVVPMAVVAALLSVCLLSPAHAQRLRSLDNRIPDWNPPSANSEAPYPTSPPQNEQEIRARLVRIDELYEKLRELVVNLRDSSFFPKDFRGSTVIGDIRGNILTADSKARLKRERALLMDQLDKHDLEAAKLAFAELERDSRAEGLRFDAIDRYWRSVESQNAGLTPYDEFLKSVNLPHWHESDIDALRESFLKQIAAGEFEKAMNESLPSLQSLTRAASLQEITSLEQSARAGQLDKWHPMVRNERCVGSPTGVAKGGHIQLDPQYPGLKVPDVSWKEVSARIDVITVTIYAVVGTEGCVTLAFALTPSGTQSFDTAATGAAFVARFLPAAVDGNTVSTAISMPFRFARRK